MSISVRKTLSVLTALILCAVSFAKFPTVSVATLEALTRDDVTIGFVLEKFGKCNLQSIDGDREYRFFYQIYLEEDGREAFLKRYGLPDVKVYWIQIYFAAGSYVNTWIKIYPEIDRTKLPIMMEPIVSITLRPRTPNQPAAEATTRP